MKLVGFLVLTYAIDLTEAMVCKIEKNQVTDRQKAAWRSFLEPNAKVIQLLHQAIVISSAKDFSFADKGSFIAVTHTKSFKEAVMGVFHEIEQHMMKNMKIGKSADPFGTAEMSIFKRETKNMINVLGGVATPKVQKNSPKYFEHGVISRIQKAGKKIAGAIALSSTIPSQLAELAAIQTTRRKRAITDDDYILSECVKRFRNIVTLLPAVNWFPSELLFRVYNLERRANKTFEYVNKAFDANVTDRVGVKPFLICSLFRDYQEMLFLTEMVDMHSTFCVSFGNASGSPSHESAKADYDGTLKKIDMKAVEAEERIKAAPQELTDSYNALVDKEAEEVAKILEKLG